MEIEVILEEGKVVITLKGVFDYKGVSDFQFETHKILVGQAPQIVIDLSNLESIFSQGLREILWLNLLVQEKKGTLTLRNVSHNVMDTLKLANIHNTIKIK